MEGRSSIVVAPIPKDRLLIVVKGKIVGVADFELRGRGCTKYLKGSADEHYYPYRTLSILSDGTVYTIAAIESDGDGSEFGELKPPPEPFARHEEVGPYPWGERR